MKKILFLFVVVASTFSFGCSNKTAMGKSAATGNAHSSANSLDWQGTYKGTLPCADCQGILTELTFNKNQTYILKTKYLGKDSIEREEMGNFEWNKEGSTIIIAGTETSTGQYQVGENRITLLDKSGNKITGALAENYVLTKQGNHMDGGKKSNVELVGTYWKLTELMGKPVIAPAGVREIHIILKKQDNRIQGFAGCNNIIGSYELKDGNLISFKDLASTRMACPDMSMEDQFKETLEKADNYSILGDTMSLNKARMAPLARFEAVYH